MFTVIFLFVLVAEYWSSTWQGAGYFHDIRFQVNHVWTIRGPSVANLKEKRGSRRGNLAQRATTMEAICVSASSSHLSKYSLKSFCSFFQQNAGLKYGKVLVPYVVSYFHDIRFQVDNVWIMRGPRFANIKNKRGSRKGNLAKTVTLMGPICVSASSNHLIKYSLQSFCFFFWQNAGLKHGKVLVPYFVSYFHEIRF